MKSLTVRLPEDLIARLEAESRERQVSRSDVVRERLEGVPAGIRPPSMLAAVEDLIRSVDDLPADVSARRKHHLKISGYGRARPR